MQQVKDDQCNLYLLTDFAQPHLPPVPCQHEHKMSHLLTKI